MRCSAEVARCGVKNVIDVHFAYSKVAVEAIKGVSGARWVPKRKHWHIPLDLASCRDLRVAFEDIDIGPELHNWATNAKRREDTLGSIAQADSAVLTRLPEVLPTLYRAVHLGPAGLQMTPAEREAAMLEPASYQAADVAFMAESRACLNGNQPGLGKTLETIAAIWESGTQEGSHLVIAPASAVEAVWLDELETWQADAGDDVEVFAPVGTKKQRQKVIDAFMASTAPTAWLVVNPEMVRYRKDETNTAPKRLPAKGSKNEEIACYCEGRDAHFHYEAGYPELHGLEWETVIIDECHKNSIRNHRSLTSQSITDLKTETRYALSGTPMRKKGGSDIWGLLHWLRPDVFTSFWRFAERYFELDDNGYGKKVKGLREDGERRLFQELSSYIVRRTKDECLEWLPPKQYIEVKCTMGTKQAKAYREMVELGAAELGDGEVTTTSILSELTRLRQFATTLCNVVDGVVVPTAESCKLEALFEKLDEYGVLEGTHEAPHVIFSQSKKLVYLVAEELRRDYDLRVEVLSGDQNKPGERRKLKHDFQDGNIDVLCIVTTAGGVALTLDAADVVHFLDETQSPDEQEQAEDRLHRASRNHQVQVLQYRTTGTVDELLVESNLDKKKSHELIMDIRRQVMK